MATRTMPVPPTAGRATCADPEWLPLVDAAMAKPGGPEAQDMKARLCRHCPVVELCHTWAMTHAEAGIWGGTSPNQRGRRGAPSISPRRRREPGTGRPTRSTPLLDALGVHEADVKRWAYDQGLTSTIMGRVALPLVEAYAAAHTDGRPSIPNA